MAELQSNVRILEVQAIEVPLYEIVTLIFSMRFATMFAMVFAMVFAGDWERFKFVREGGRCS